jgi:hypothetical protein
MKRFGSKICKCHSTVEKSIEKNKTTETIRSFKNTCYIENNVLYKHHKVVLINLRFLNKLDSILFKITKSQIQSHEIFL